MAPSTAVAHVEVSAHERALLMGDLAKLSEVERAALITRICESTGLNPYTRPLQYISLSGRLTLYTTRDATDQLRKLHGVSVVELTGREDGDIYIVTAKVADRTGRTDMATGAVLLAKGGEARANAKMKAETKAKRRATLSICGLGFLDESEMDTIPGAQPVPTTVREETPKQIAASTARIVNHDTGEVQAQPSAMARRLYAVLREHAAELKQAMPALDAEWAAPDVDEVINSTFTWLLDHHEGLNHAPATADQLVKLSKAYSVYQQAGVGLVTPEQLTEGGVEWLLDLLRTLLAPAKPKRAPVVEDADAVEAAELATAGV